MFHVLQQDKMPQTPPFPVMYGPNGYNKNIYKAKEEDYEGLYYHDNNLVSGSLEALIEHLVPTVAYYPDVSIKSIQPYSDIGFWVVKTHGRSFLCLK